jgi:predicted DNA-binding ribbon-helix-helix protein
LSAQEDNQSILESRNVTVGNKRTSMRLEPQMWDSIELIARRENLTLNNLCTQIDRRRKQRNSPIGLTSATRVFIISYYRALVGRYEARRNSGSRDIGLGVRDPGLKGASLATWVLDELIAVDEAQKLAGRPYDGRAREVEPHAPLERAAEARTVPAVRSRGRPPKNASSRTKTGASKAGASKAGDNKKPGRKPGKPTSS